MLFINNLAVLHSREGFRDDDRNTRHVVRLWLSNDALGWRLPPPLRSLWEKFFDDEETEEKWEIIPTPKLTFSEIFRFVT